MAPCACYCTAALAEHTRRDASQAILQTSFPLDSKSGYLFCQFSEEALGKLKATPVQQQYKSSCPDGDRFLQGLSCLQLDITIPGLLRSALADPDLESTSTNEGIVALR